ncbi:MAG: capsular polysaccharide biosynthesis protein [Clostridia bacterium]|nr:capsular polysaccharide biosynthesis protein [Clostridia bacterium]MBR3639196.1 capsular polysaccharide biosynthesis protein [Clostridia bacterium]
MIDFHSHVLPGIDDGSRDTDESLKLLKMCSEQGVTKIAATPHFYPNDDTPERFLRRRNEAAHRLKERLFEGAPEIILGAEVYYFAGISTNESVGDLRLGNTRILLLEMPFAKWSPSMVSEILDLHGRNGITVMMAHIERYLGFQSADVWDSLLKHGVVMQSNAGFFTDWRTKRRALRMFRSGRIHVLGSDCHNTKDRTENMGKAYEILNERDREYLKDNEEYIIGLGAKERAAEFAGAAGSP